ncbi:uncharacterized protein LOC134669294 [Cydia fagiglandana]|uniref:uncharacterized protein LOC134669294 n=1 Tax=Cydia fagiglandana TaxID=1458189 RepID=UPI002FEE597B
MDDNKPGSSRPSSLLTFPSPKKKRPKTGQLSSSEKTVLVNVYKYVEETWPKDKYPYKTEIVQKTAEIVGVSTPTVYSVLKEYKTHGRVQSPPPPATKPSLVNALDEIELGGIRRKVHQFYFANEIPSIDKMLDAVNSDESLPNFSRTSFFKVLKKLGFKYSKRNRKSMLIDRSDIALWRINYLNKIEEERKAGKKIYYLDETWVNEGHTKEKVWQDTTIKSTKEAHRQGLSTGLKNPSGKGKRLILGHIGSSTGFLKEGELIFLAGTDDGDYHKEMNGANFEKWFDVILNNVEPNSVIVMDNAPYHSRKLEKTPILKTKKAEIQEWLRSKNIAFGPKEYKEQLLKRVRKVKKKYEKYVVDEKAKERGITVIRLPPYHCELNPIELIWAQVKGEIAAKNKTFKLKELRDLLPEALGNVTAANWKSCEDHTIKEEETMRGLDNHIDNLTDRFIINVGGGLGLESSSSSSDSE